MKWYYTVPSSASRPLVVSHSQKLVAVHDFRKRGCCAIKIWLCYMKINLSSDMQIMKRDELRFYEISKFKTKNSHNSIFMFRL